jgi:hypothetical protein
MFSNSRHGRRLFMGVVSIVATGLLAVGLGSCGGSGSNGNSGSGGSGSTPTLALSPSSIKLTAGGSGQQASLLLTTPGSTTAATVTVSGLPTGVLISPATLSLTPGTALPVTLTAAASAATSTAAISFSTTVSGQSVSTSIDCFCVGNCGQRFFWERIRRYFRAAPGGYGTAVVAHTDPRNGCYPQPDGRRGDSRRVGHGYANGDVRRTDA